jgi:hypothetical protein
METGVSLTGNESVEEVDQSLFASEDTEEEEEERMGKEEPLQKWQST